ncbi:MAG TPA: XrtA/PEP-CTERM system exopolysaccharide export protein [Salinisphaeraceae bacterium]|nr:XrtA/PEP-CTERM system exopolysaccharide export protein [Salinisphaeraceae bacterium]
MNNKTTNRHLAAFLLSLCVSILLAGCATSSSIPAPDKELLETKEYTIGRMDSLMVYVRDNPDLSMEVTVRPDGKISIPLVQDMKAAGKTPIELATDLEGALSQYIRSPLVTVVVTAPHGVYSDQIRVVGQAAAPQAIPYQSGMTLLDVMIQVGGLTQFAAGNRAKLVRTVDGEEQTYGINIEALLNGDIDQNVTMRPGDVIIIPRSLL